MPQTLSALGVDHLPQRTVAPHPTERDMPRLSHSFEMKAPTPPTVMLHGMAGPSDPGKIADEPITLIANCMLPVVEREGLDLDLPTTTKEHSQKPPPAWSLDKSIFAPRKQTSDGHSLWTTKRLLSRAFEIDWSRCNNERFRVYISDYQRALGGGRERVDVVMKEIKDTLFQHLEVINNAFAYYASLGRNSENHDGHSMSLAAFFDMMRMCKLVEEDSSFCKTTDLESIFIAVNLEDSGPNVTHEQRMLNMLNDDNALVRFEFMQSIVRISVAKYIRTKMVSNVSLALKYLFERDLLCKLPPEAHHRPDDFRRARLYKEDVDIVLRRNEEKLSQIFAHYSISEQELVIGSNDPRFERGSNVLTMSGWESFLFDSRLISADEDQEKKDRKDRFSRSHARLAFIWAQVAPRNA